MVNLVSGIWDSAHGIFITNNVYFCLSTAGYTLVRVVPFALSVKKTTPAGKKYASAAGDACDKLQLCESEVEHVEQLA